MKNSTYILKNIIRDLRFSVLELLSRYAMLYLENEKKMKNKKIMTLHEIENYDEVFSELIDYHKTATYRKVIEIEGEFYSYEVEYPSYFSSDSFYDLNHGEIILTKVKEIQYTTTRWVEDEN